MSKKINVTLKFDEDLDLYLSKEYPLVVDYRICSQSLDARNAPKGRAPRYHYILDAVEEGECFNQVKYNFPDISYSGPKPLIVGLGPAGMFTALRLLEYGIPSVIIERGVAAQKRMKDIARYWRYGVLNEESNVCFGEGGAGLFSDGKLITRIKSPHIQYVMDRLVDFGAPSEIAYKSNPHLGSNRMRRIITQLTHYLKESGCEIYYSTKCTDLVIDHSEVKGVFTDRVGRIESEFVVLATGHSARDVYSMLLDKQVCCKPKDFAVGVRVEHPRAYMDRMQYGQYCEQLGAARYRLSHHDKVADRGCFSFCMCPGGYVLSSSTESDGIVVNGMSNFHHNSHWSNSALVVGVKKGTDFATDTTLSLTQQVKAGLKFQTEIEQRAFVSSKDKASGRELPAVRMSDFMDGKVSSTLPKSSTPSGIFSADLSRILPTFVVESLYESLRSFDRKIKGFYTPEAILIAPETRTSSSVTIERDRDTLESVNISNLFPCGEGAGYAGGITSAAVDGVKVAESIIAKISSQQKGRES